MLLSMAWLRCAAKALARARLLMRMVGGRAAETMHMSSSYIRVGRNTTPTGFSYGSFFSSFFLIVFLNFC